MAEAIVGVLFENLKSLISREFGRVWGVQTEMRKLSSNLSAIQAVLEDAETQQIKSKAVQDWLSKLKDVAYDADDILDEWATNDEFLLLCQPAEPNDCLSKQNQVPCNSLSSCFDFKQVVFRYKIAKKIKEIRERFDEIAKEKFDFHFREVGLAEGVATRTTTLTGNRETSSVVREPQIYGRDEDKESLVQLLLDNVNNENKVSVLPIHGIGGLGKTTLAQLVYNDERVVNHFDDRIWVCVSDDFKVKRISKEILESLSKSYCGLDNLDTIQDQLHQRLERKKFLLVLDDAWNEKQNEWNLLKNSLTFGAKGSSIIITTRLQTVAFITGTAPIYKLHLLSESDCWLLFRYYAFGIGNEEKLSLVNIGQEIVKKCGGVPLAAKALGSLLRFKSEEKQWELIRDSEIWNLEGGKETTILPALRLSYYNLSLCSRQCFAYCSLFPKDSAMSRELLIHLWMANGLLQSNERLPLEDIGEDIFNELLLHSFFQDIENDRYGNIRTCKIHDLLHDLASSIMKDDYKHLDGGKRNLSTPKKARHLSVTLPSFSESLDIYDPGLSSQPCLRTLLFFRNPFFSGFIDLSIHQMFIISQLTTLRTLSLKGTNVKMLPPSIGDLKHLRYLNLDSCGIASLPESFFRLRNLQMLNQTDNELEALPASIVNLENLRYLSLSNSRKMTSLPESICNLKNLHTLILAHCSQLKELPRGTRNIVSLRHLDTHSCLGLAHMPIGIGSLTGLETLRLFVLSQERGRDGGIKELHGLNLLRGFIRIDRLEHLKYSVEAKGANLMRKEYILNLLLNWSGNSSNSKNSKEVLEGLQPHHNIEGLHISRYPGSEFPTWMEMAAPFSSFPRLKEMILHIMHNLVEWSLNWKEHEIPSLQYLSVIDCKRLKVLPARLCNLRSLTTLIIHGCAGLLSLPPELGKLTSLTHLFITDCNSLSSLPKMGVNGPTCSLKVLSINGCEKLSSLSEALQYLTSLEKLFIGHCPQLELSKNDFDHLISLQLLEIEQLSLSSLPESITNMGKLQNLTVKRCNKLRRWPNGMDKLEFLQNLSLEYCDYLRELPKCLKDVFVIVTTLDSNNMWFHRRN